VNTKANTSKDDMITSLSKRNS